METYWALEQRVPWRSRVRASLTCGLLVANDKRCRPPQSAWLCEILQNALLCRSHTERPQQTWGCYWSYLHATLVCTYQPGGALSVWNYVPGFLRAEPKTKWRGGGEEVGWVVSHHIAESCNGSSSRVCGVYMSPLTKLSETPEMLTVEPGEGHESPRPLLFLTTCL